MLPLKMKPALPPPPPSLCAEMAGELAPYVVRLATLITSTALDWPPPPPDWPILTAPASPGAWLLGVPAKVRLAIPPALPPPPPTLCARIASEFVPQVVMAPELVTTT